MEQAQAGEPGVLLIIKKRKAEIRRVAIRRCGHLGGFNLSSLKNDGKEG
jgi:hypothetical protein